MADIIMIGAGHNGLVAACYLARAGLDVTVLEAAPVIGGMTSTLAAIPEAPGHKINVCAVEPGLLRATDLVADLGLARYGYREVEVDPFCVHLLPDGASVAFWRDPRRTATEISRFSRADGDAYLEFARSLDATLALGLPVLTTNPCRPKPAALARLATTALRRRRDLRSVAGLLAAPFGQVLAEHFEHPVVRNAFTIMAAGPNASDGSGVRLMPIAFYHRFGLGRPVGGTQALVDALAGVLASLGGTVRTGAAVAEILVTGGRAVGVRLESGEELRAAKAVVATSDPRMVLTDMLPAGVLDHAHQTRAERIPAYADNVSHLKVDLALAGQLSLERHERWRGDGVDLRKPTLLLGSHDASGQGYLDARSGRLPTRIGVWSVIPTAADPSQAPPGQDTLYTYSWPFPVQPAEGWPAVEAAAGKLVLDEVGQIYDGLDFEIGRRIEGPETLAARLRVTNGCVEHVDFSPFRQGPLRPAFGFGGYRTPVAGLYLGGAGSHPGPAVHGIPGRMAAREVLRGLKRAR